MERQKKKQKGITLIALVISIIVMLILAGVSLNMTIGENGIIKQAQSATYQQSRAVLEEYINQYYVEHHDEFESANNKALALKNYSGSSSWFYQGAPLGYVVDSDGNSHYFINVEGLPDDVKSGVKGGNANGKRATEMTYQDYANMVDVYGVTSDLRVYYCSSGKESLEGVNFAELDEADSTMEVFESGSAMAKLITGSDDKNLTLEDLKSIKTLTITAESGITNFKDFYALVSLQELTLDGLTLSNLDGIENASQLYYVYLKNCVIDNYSSLGKLGNKLKYLYLYNIDDNELEKLCSKTIGIGNYDLSSLNYLGIFGDSYNVFSTTINSGRIYLAGGKSSKQITSLASLRELSAITKKSVKYLSLQNNNITDTDNMNNLGYISDFTNLYYLQIPNNSIRTLKGLENFNSLQYLIAANNKLGENLDEADLNREKDCLSSLTNKTNLYYVDFTNNNNLRQVDYLANDIQIKYLYLAGCNSLMSVNNIATIINGCGQYYSLPCKYLNAGKYNVNDYYSNVELVTYEELYSDLYNNQYIKNLNLKGVKISNQELNTILSSMPKLQVISLENTNISSLDFISTIPSENSLIQAIDFKGTPAVDLSKLEYCENLKGFRIDNELIDITKIQKTISRASYGCTNFNGWGGIIANQKLLLKLKDCTEITRIEVRYGRISDEWINLDLSNLSNLTSIDFGMAKVNVKLPNSCNSITCRTGACVDLSNFEKIQRIGFHALEYSGVDGAEIWNKFWNKIPNNVEIDSMTGDYLCDFYFNVDLTLKNIKIKSMVFSFGEIGNSCDTYFNTIASCDSLTFNRSLLNNTTLDKISDFSELKKLTIKNDKTLSSLKELSKCTLLETLIIRDCAITSVIGIENLKSLRYIDFSNNNIFDTSTIINESGDKVTINNLETLSNLNKTGALRNLYLAGNSGITNWTPVSSLNNWEEKSGW